MWLLALLYVVCASTFTLSKKALDFGSPLFFTGARMTVAGMVLLGYYFIRHRSLQTIKREDYGLFAQIVLIYIYAGYVLDILGLEGLSSAKSCLLYNLAPFVTALLSYVWFKEELTMKKFLGLVIGFLGFLPVLLTVEPSEKSMAMLSKPELLTLGAVLASSYGWVVMRKLIKRELYSISFINGFGMFFGGLLSFVTSYATESWSPLPVSHWYSFMLYTGLTIVVANLIFSNFYSFMLHRYTATFLSFAGFSAPLFAALLGFVFLGERVSQNFFFTAFFVMVGLYLFYQEELRQGYVVSENE